jgi:hypothetical protein
MSSGFNFFADEVAYRAQTGRQAAMPGVTMPTFVCVACKRRSVTKGCKQLSIGRICAACNEAREYRKAIREAKQ